MSKKTGNTNYKQMEEKIKPILEGLTLDVVKKKPDNIVSIIKFYFNQPLFMVKFLEELENPKGDLTDEQEKEYEELQKELEKYKEIELVEKSRSDSESGSDN